MRQVGEQNERKQYTQRRGEGAKDEEDENEARYGMDRRRENGWRRRR